MATKTQEKPKGPAGAQNVGKVVQVIGPVLDIEFEPERLPEIYNAVVIDHRGNGAPPIRLTAEVQQHIGRNQVRAVAMTSTDGVVRGMEVVDTGKPITVPVGQAALGRILNVLGEPVDEGDPIPPDAERWPIHRETPKFVDLEPKTEVFETGIKVIDHRGNGEGGGTPSIRLTAEVQQHIGRNQVRAVAMTSTDGVVRGIDRKSVV